MNIKKILEKHGFTVSKDGDCWNIQQYTPEGEDWNLCFSKLEEIKDYLINSYGAYKYTLNKKIESIDIDGDTATIGVSKFNPKNPETTNNKIYTKDKLIFREKSIF